MPQAFNPLDHSRSPRTITQGTVQVCVRVGVIVIGGMHPVYLILWDLVRCTQLAKPGVLGSSDAQTRAQAVVLPGELVGVTRAPNVPVPS